MEARSGRRRRVAQAEIGTGELPKRASGEQRVIGLGWDVADATHATAALTRRRSPCLLSLCYARTMAPRSPFPPIVCIVDFHHARYAESCCAPRAPR